MVNYNIIDKDIAVITFDMEGSANVLNEASITAFAAHLDAALEDDNVKGVIVNSAKRDFIVGADLNMLLGVEDVATCFEQTKLLDQLFRKMETAPKPIVAAMNGTTLGGGLELCLACHYRVLVDKKAQIGLPEVTLGLLPGGGGTQRLPRMIGLEAASQMLMEGKKVAPKVAHKMGIVNELASDEGELMEKATSWAIQATPDDLVKPWDKKGFKIPGGGPDNPKIAQMFMAAGALLTNKTYGNYPAPKAILECVYQGLQLPFDHAVMLESKYFAQLVMSKEAKNMIRTLFFAIGDANKGAARPAGYEKNTLNKIGILGAGMMGAGIAYVTANNGMDTVLKDVSVENAEKGKSYSTALLDKKKKKGYIDDKAYQAVLDKIQTTDQPSDLEGCDLIVEAVFENRELKAKVTKESEAVIADDSIFASNTSTLPITGLAEASVRPENFIGLHFFSPVDKMPLVEIIVGEQTSDYALAKSLDYVKAIKKTPIVVNDSRGFFTSRVFSTYLNEAIHCLAEGIHPVLIENAGKQAGMPVGPLALSDEVSIDLSYKIMNQTEADTGIAPDPEVKALVSKFVEELDRKGKKNKKGFYDYPEKGKKHIWAGLADHYPVAAQQPDSKEVSQRLLYLQAIEAVKCLDENVVRTPTDADIGSILGWGFPPYTGGVISYIDFVGVPEFVATAKRFAEQYGERFTPPARLVAMAENGETFYGKKAMEPA